MYNRKNRIKSLSNAFYVVVIIVDLVLGVIIPSIGSDNTGLTVFLFILLMAGTVFSIIIFNNKIKDMLNEADYENRKFYDEERDKIVERFMCEYKKYKEKFEQFKAIHPNSKKNQKIVYISEIARECYFNGNELCLTSLSDNLDKYLGIPEYSYSLNIYDFSKYFSEVEKKIKTILNECDLLLMAVPLDNIKYFNVIGDIYTTTEISGGGGGGSSLSGAIVGGIIAGEAGAIVGSRKPVEAITSSTKVHDERIVELLYKNGDVVKTIKFNYEIYKTLKEWMPEKDYAFVLTSSEKNKLLNKSTDETNSKPSDVKARLKQLNELKEEGLISDEQYLTKKDELLKMI